MAKRKLAKPKDTDPEQRVTFLAEVEKLKVAGVLPNTDEADGELDRLLSHRLRPVEPEQ